MTLLGTYGTGAMLAAHGVHSLLAVVGVLIVLGCLAGAGYCAYLRNALGAVLLLAVAIVAAFLLL